MNEWVQVRRNVATPTLPPVLYVGVLEVSRPVQMFPGLDKDVRSKQIDLRLYPYFDRPTAPLTPPALFTPHVKNTHTATLSSIPIQPSRVAMGITTSALLNRPM